MADYDNSTVYHIDHIPDAEQSEESKNMPWIFETDAALAFFRTEDEACEAQRNYRVANNFDPMTGLPD